MQAKFLLRVRPYRKAPLLQLGHCDYRIYVMVLQDVFALRTVQNSSEQQSPTEILKGKTILKVIEKNIISGSRSQRTRYNPATTMVLKTELCRFSGAKIYPGKGIRFIRSDSQVFLFANSKCKRYFHNRLRPAKLTWTAVYRKQHKKDIAAETVKKRRRATKKPYSRSIVGATLEVIQKRRTEKPEVRDAAREAALREIKERIKKTKDEKKAKKAEVMSKAQKTGKSNVPKGALPKGPKLGGGGGKR
ncbi:TRASH domain-containing protein [Forsythia ovata]|uniref:TRASH domain-containing protein n=1 Tax=Forsythia ovata TaxID=205694 RepID=A0ABD1WF24_9LAMI